MDEDAARDRIDELAREWVGTPFHDHARLKGVGTDCAQILLAIFEEAGFIPPTDVGHYSPQWFLHQKEERYLSWMKKFAHEIAPDRVRHGDVVLYKIGHVFAHGAIVIKPGWPHIIHAHAGGKVVRRAFGTSPHLGVVVQDTKYFSFW
jgi:cell wall-associated NlpC family hydrolase